MKFVLALAAFVLVAQALPSNISMWESFKQAHGKAYESDVEEARRFNIFAQNLKKIQEHNERHAKGQETYKMAVNKFADMTQEEFKTFLGRQGKNPVKADLEAHKPSGLALPTTVDWRDKKAVTGVKDQGQCGSCWAFSTTGGLEGANFLKHGKLLSLSEQQLVDCAGGQYGNAGCGGGLMESAVDYVRDNGITSESQYPYTAEDGTCSYKSSDAVLKTVTGYTPIESGSESGLQDAVANNGPVSVAVDATYFQFYDSGVFTNDWCSNENDQLNHGVLAAGYGTADGQDYWLIKNSWGASWGEEGYIRLARNDGNLCGVATDAIFPLVS